MHIALLRGINVGGRNMLAMTALKTLLESLEFTDVRSLLQSGNLIFSSDKLTGAALEHLLETETEKRLKASPHYVIRTAAQWQRIVSRNPFADEADKDPGHLVVMCLKNAPKAQDVEKLRLAIQGPEIIRADANQLYIVYPQGIGRSKLTNALIEKHLNTRGTGRNWNTVIKLAAMIRE